MGHLRLGRLPKTRRWIEVVQLLDTNPEDTTGIAASVVDAADRRLRELSSDPSLGYCFWLLTRIAWASRKPDFRQTLSGLGIEADTQESVLSFISRLAEHVHTEIDPNTTSGHFADLSSLALRRALSETVAQHTGSLLGANVDSLQQAFRVYSTQDQFGRLSHKFFGDFFARTILSLVDRELSHHVGQDKSFRSSEESAAFIEALDLHARESARIMETFAAGWYSKHNWEAKGEVSMAEAQGFVAIALALLGLVGRPRRETEKWFYLLLAVVGVILSFGARNQILSFPKWPILSLPFYLPFRYLFEWVPGFRAMRGPDRFAYLAVLGLAVRGARQSLYSLQRPAAVPRAVEVSSKPRLQRRRASGCADNR
jgi:hypothetical protein